MCEARKCSCIKLLHLKSESVILGNAKGNTGYKVRCSLFLKIKACDYLVDEVNEGVDYLSETGLRGTIVDTADLNSTFCLPSP